MIAYLYVIVKCKNNVLKAEKLIFLMDKHSKLELQKLVLRRFVNLLTLKLK